jgi:hypothetical protein
MCAYSSFQSVGVGMQTGKQLIPTSKLVKVTQLPVYFGSNLRLKISIPHPPHTYTHSVRIAMGWEC